MRYNLAKPLSVIRSMTQARFLLATLPLLVACLSSPTQEGTSAPQEDTKQAKTPIERAEGLIASGDYAGARQALLEHLDDEQDDTQSRYLLAKTLAHLGELRGARAEVERVVAERPDSPVGCVPPALRVLL